MSKASVVKQRPLKVSVGHESKQKVKYAIKSGDERTLKFLEEGEGYDEQAWRERCTR